MFSVESILFKDSFSNTSNTIKVNTSKSMDELVYDAYKSEEDLKFFDTYNMLNEYNTNQKVRMLKRLNNITNNIRNKNITNSCESYIHSLEEDTNKDTNNKEKKKNIFIRFFTWIKEIAIKFAKAVKKAVLKLVEFITKPFKKKKEKDTETGFSNGSYAIAKPINEEKWNYLIKIAEKYGMRHTDSSVSILPLEGFDKKNIDIKTSSFTKIVGGVNKIVNSDLDNGSKHESIRNELNNIKNSQDFKSLDNEISFNSDQEKIQYYFYGGKSTNVIIKKTDFEDKIKEIANNFTKYKQELQNICKYTATECEKKAKEIDAICTKVLEFITKYYVDTTNSINADPALSNDIKRNQRSSNTTTYVDNTSLVNEIKNITGGLNKVKTEVDKTSILATSYFVDIFKLIRGTNI